MKHSPRPTGTPSAILAPIHRDMAPQLMARLKRLAVLTAILLLASGAWAASKYRVLYSFQGGSDGADPYGGLTFDAAGNLYGATYAGGNQNTLCNTYGETGCGTIFKLSPGTGAWTKSLLYAFCSQTNCDDGEQGRNSLRSVHASRLPPAVLMASCPGGGEQQLRAGANCPPVPTTYGNTLTFTISLAESDGGYPTSPLIIDNRGSLAAKLKSVAITKMESCMRVTS